MESTSGAQGIRSQRDEEVQFLNVCIVCGYHESTSTCPTSWRGAAKKWGFNLSALAQEAIRGQLGIYNAGSWLGTLQISSTRQVSHDLVMAALDAVREAAPEPHG